MEKKYIDGLVSVIMPAYNAEKNIVNAIDSVLAQTYSNWELIVVNDCSTDNTLKIVEEKYSKEDRIKIYTLSKNSGVASARNYGFSKAQGRYLAFLDSDDQWLEDKLNLQIKFMKESSAYFVVSSYGVVDENGNLKDKVFIPKTDISLKTQLKGSQVGCLTVVLDRFVTGDFLMPNIGHEDYVTWNSLIKKFGTAYSIPQVTALYRDGGNSLSSNKLKAAKWQWNIYRDIEQLSLLKSLNYFMRYSINGFLKYKKKGESFDNNINFDN